MSPLSARTPCRSFFAKFCFLVLGLCAGLGLTGSLIAQTTGVSPSGLWREVDDKPLLAARGGITAGKARRGVVPANYRTLHLDRALLGTKLAKAPMEFSASAKSAPLEIELPIPESTRFARFKVEESPIMEAGLAARYPDIHTYTAHGIDDPKLEGRLDVTPQGFHGMIFSPAGQFFIDPYFADGSDPETAIAYYKRDYAKADNFHCVVRHVRPVAEEIALKRRAAAAERPTGASLRTYRLALAATAEYTAAVGGGSVDDDGTFISAGTVAGAMAAMVTTVNRVVGVYEREFAIRMVLVNNTDQLIYLNPTTDPYTNDDGETMLDENQTNVDKIIGTANYDIGHVFSTGGGGIAGLGVVCDPDLKAEGVTGSPTPTGDGYDIDYVAHEMGHQFGADHTFNSTTSSCGGGNRNATTAYEPGSGTTIMAYAGICTAVETNVQDLAAHSDDYFHTGSYDEIDAYTTTGTGKNAFSTTATGNTPPTITTPTAYTIPISTPFALTTTGADTDNDALTYCWEEFDLGSAVNATTLAGLDNGAAPIFRSYAPTTSPTRVFPSLTYILNNANVPPLHNASGFLTGEALPSKAHTNGLNFRCTVRDNHAAGGGVNYTAVKLTVAAGAGPFKVTAPNTATALAGGSTQTVTWSVANTTAAPVSCANVKISLSLDGGQTFPTVLSASTANTGSATVTLPDLGTTQGRIKVEAVGNIFFDISDANFTITSNNTGPGFTPSGMGLTLVRGTPIDTTATVGTATAGSSALSSVSVTGAPAGVTVTASLVGGNNIVFTGRADCGPGASSFEVTYPVTVTVTDAAGNTGTGIVNVTVDPNLTPTLGAYTNASVAAGSSVVITPDALPDDENLNLAAVPVSVQPGVLPGGGTLTVDEGTGAVTVATTSASTAGTTAVTVTCQDDCGATAVQTFNVTVTGGATPTPTPTPTPGPSAPGITSALNAGGTLGSAFSYQITASNGPTSFGASGLPAGLTVDTGTGLILGVPAVAGTFNVNLSATNAAGTGKATLILVIAPVPALPAPSITSAGAASGEVGVAFTYQIVATNTPTAYGASGLPPGLSLNAATGLISGTPTQDGTFGVGLSATNNGGTGTGGLTIKVSPTLPVVTVMATVPTVTSGSGDAAQFRLFLSSAPTTPVVVYYRLKGTAANGKDFVLLSGHKKIKPGKLSKPIFITPKGTVGSAGKKTVKFVVVAADGYRVGTPAVAKVKIIKGR